jgi:hypothetical protein
MFRGAADLKIHQNIEIYLSPPKYIYYTYLDEKEKKLK